MMQGRDFPSRKFYVQESDSSLPSKKENIVLTLDGMKELAEYYKEKYNIDILPFNSSIANAPEVIAQLINQARQKAARLEHYRCGFIFNNTQAGNHGHAMPMIWEKNEKHESLIFLDTGQYLGDVSYVNYHCDFIKMSSFDKSASLSDLPGSAQYAYILIGNELYYVDKVNNKITEPLMTEDLFSGEKTLDSEKLSRVIEFQEKLRLSNQHTDCSVCKLSEEDIKQLESITEITTNVRGRNAMKFRRDLLSMSPNTELYSSLGKRQIDQTSCATDAMTMLKDGLQLATPMTEVARNKQVTKVDNVNLFHMPEELLKTAQIGSYPEKSKADPNKVIHVHHVKDSQGKKTGETVPVTLRDFRQRFDVDVKEDDRGVKKFGTYTLHKGELFAKIIRNRWEMKQAAQNSKQSTTAVLFKNMAINGEVVVNSSELTERNSNHATQEIMSEKVDNQTTPDIKTAIDSTQNDKHTTHTEPARKRLQCTIL